MKFNTLTQFAMPMTMNRSKSTHEAEFQYGGRSLSKTAGGNKSAVD